MKLKSNLNRIERNKAGRGIEEDNALKSNRTRSESNTPMLEG